MTETTKQKKDTHQYSTFPLRIPTKLKNEIVRTADEREQSATALILEILRGHFLPPIVPVEELEETTHI